MTKLHEINTRNTSDTTRKLNCLSRRLPAVLLASSLALAACSAHSNPTNPSNRSMNLPNQPSPPSRIAIHTYPVETQSTQPSPAILPYTYSGNTQPASLSTLHQCDPISDMGGIGSNPVMYCEEVNVARGTEVLENFKTASGIDGTLADGSTVLVDCIQEGPAAAAPSAANDPAKIGVAEWYHIAQPFDGYAATNSFLNDGSHNDPYSSLYVYDPHVPRC